MRALTFALPVAVAVAGGALALWLMSAGGRGPGLAEGIALMLAVGLATLLLFSLIGERGLTLAALLEISMKFSYRPSSRLSIALRTGSHRQLLEALGRVREALAWADAPTGTAAVSDANLRIDRVENVLTLVAVLSSMEPGTRDHSERVGWMTNRLAAELGLDNDAREKLRWAALVHDIGKLSVPRDILGKPGPLTADEWTVIYYHPIAGARIVAPLEGWLGDWSRAVLEHHERWDGSGYPLGLSGDQISVAGRIVAVADSYEVMTSARVYKKRISRAEARLELMRNAGGQFDPDVVAAFIAVTGGAGHHGPRRWAWLARPLPGVAVVMGALAAAPGSAVAMSFAALGLMGAVAFGPAVLTGDSSRALPPSQASETVAGAVSQGAVSPSPAAPGSLPPNPARIPAPRASGAPLPPPQPLLSTAASIVINSGWVVTEGGGVFGGGNFTGTGTGWAATVDYGDGDGTIALPLAGQSFQFQHLYLDEGNYRIVVTLVNAALQLSRETQLIRVVDYPIGVVLPSSGSYSLGSGGPFSVNGHFVDPSADTWTATMSVDGGPASGLGLGGHNFVVSVPFSTTGSHTVTVTVIDDHGGSGSATINVNVTP